MTEERKINIRHRSAASGYTVRITSGSLDTVGHWARECVGNNSKKAAVISNPTVYTFYGEPVSTSIGRAGFKISSWLMNDGERYKNFRSLEAALKFLSAEQMMRDDVIIALGGGVVGDLAGFAAAIYMRGIKFLQIPTTLLAMIDSSVGGKTGVNTETGKNLVGAFHQPAGVLADMSTLETLPKRELTAGFCEAVKQGAIGGQKLFNKTGDYLSKNPPERGFGDIDRLVDLVADHIRFKASIVTQDERESSIRHDPKSRKILNFGHTFGHALEKATNYGRLRHGEAVGYGILLAGELSKTLDLLGHRELKLLYDVVHRAGKLPPIPDVDHRDILDALKFDKKSSGTELKWVLLRGIGRPMIVSGKDISRAALTTAVKKILKS